MKFNTGIHSFTKPSILKNLLLTFIGFGLVIGILVPFVAGAFVEWKAGMYGWFTLLAISAGLVIGLADYFLVNYVLLAKLRRISDVAHAIGNKDISQRCDLTSHDLIGEIADSFNQMADNLHLTLSELADSSTQLSAAVSHMTQIASETDQCLSDQSSQTEQIATAINEMTATVQEVARNAEEAATAANSAKDEASNGALVATEAIGGIEVLASKVERVTSMLEELRTDSDNVGGVLEVIRGIAEQTNLLALNAAIEAARAGEQGRGFAVVADEVRTLASRTQDSTQEIQKIIESLQTKVSSAVDEVQSARKSAGDGSEQVENAALSLAEIAGAVGNMQAINAQIASAAEQQRCVSEEINRKITEIMQHTEQTVLGGKQTANESEQLAMLASRLSSLIQGFKM